MHGDPHALIPRALLFGNPDREHPQISPEGSRLACLAPVDGVLNVWVGGLGSDRFAPVTAERDRSIPTFSWAYDGRHILYLQDRDGSEEWHVHALDLQTGESRDLTPLDGVQARVIALEREVPGHVLVGLNAREPHLHDAYLVEIGSGRRELVAENPGFSWLPSWVADAELHPRAGVRPQPDGGVEIWVVDPGKRPWRRLLSADPDEALMTSPVGFSRDGTRLHVIAPMDRDTSQLWTVDLATGRAGSPIGDPSFDVASVRLDPVTRDVQLVAVLKERLEYLAPDRAAGDALAGLRALAHGDPVIVDADGSDRRWVVRLDAPDSPPRYSLHDRDTNRTSLLFVTHSGLAPYRLVPTEPFTFRARDGLPVHGYITFPSFPPSRSDPGKGRHPAVLLVHGGPYERDGWHFNPEVQWLANRGYVCLQVNYRGSTGYGKRFLCAGDREWAGRMQDDLVDAVTWAVDEGHIDPGRVAIYGGSYGGYAALVGAAFTPDIFRCAISFVGPTNLNTLLESVPPWFAGLLPQLRRRVGDPRVDADFLWSRSPLSRVDQIRIPVLVAHGANDPRVAISESERLVAELRSRGVPHEYLVFRNEGHGLVGEGNRLRFTRTAELFLAEHLGGRAQR